MTDPIMDNHVDSRTTDDEDESLGFFPSWRSLYWSVVIYTLACVLVLYWITVALDFRIS